MPKLIYILPDKRTINVEYSLTRDDWAKVSYEGNKIHQLNDSTTLKDGINLEVVPNTMIQLQLVPFLGYLMRPKVMFEGEELYGTNDGASPKTKKQAAKTIGLLIAGINVLLALAAILGATALGLAWSSLIFGGIYGALSLNIDTYLNKALYAIIGLLCLDLSLQLIIPITLGTLPSIIAIIVRLIFIKFMWDAIPAIDYLSNQKKRKPLS